MLILVTGGSRSGKSSFALELATRGPQPRCFLATAQALDDEMARRIAAHQRARPAGWRLVEEPLDVPRALTRALSQSAVVVLDCVTLWMSNLLLADERFSEEEASAHAQRLVDAARGEGLQLADTAGEHLPAEAARSQVPLPRTVIVVTNEVGWGVVPGTALGRRFRDIAGRANQVIARGSDEVYLMASGIPLRIKPQQEQGA